jgi:hypothetical protein
VDRRRDLAQHDGYPKTEPYNSRDRYRIDERAPARTLLASDPSLSAHDWEDAPGPLTMLAELGVSVG